jgi:hypothetical protein
MGGWISSAELKNRVNINGTSFSSINLVGDFAKAEAFLNGGMLQ